MYSKTPNKNSYFPNNFESACKKIESDPNYQPTITNTELFALVVDALGCAIHTPRKSALAIQKSNINPLSATGESLGVVYQIKIAKKGMIDEDSDIPVWHIDDSAVIFVNKKGDLSLHSKENAEKGLFTSPLTHLSADDFLNCSSLHQQPAPSATNSAKV